MITSCNIPLRKYKSVEVGKKQRQKQISLKSTNTVDAVTQENLTKCVDQNKENFNNETCDERSVNDYQCDENKNGECFNENDEYIDDNGNGYDNENENVGYDDYEEEYSFDIEFSRAFFDPLKFHHAFFKFLRIVNPQKDSTNDQEKFWKIFSTLAALCDPYTQPFDAGDNNEMILSVDLVSDLVLSLILPDYQTNGEIGVPEFDMAFDLASILEKMFRILNCDNETRLLSINNDETHWIFELSKWIPHDNLSNASNIATDFHHLTLLYSISVVSMLVIHKLYKSNENVCLNPFLSFFLQVWKNQTKIILLGIEIDRRDEELNFPGYPEVIRNIIKGASALRSMVALILNDDFEKRIHDLKHESLINFMSPWGRKSGTGSITSDMRIYVAALLVLGSDLEDVTELLFNFEPEDRYDEDIKYMFELELEDDIDDLYHVHHKQNFKKVIGDDLVDNSRKNKLTYIDDCDNLDNVVCKKEFTGEQDHIEENDDESENEYEYEREYELHPDCHCIFEEEEEDNNDNDNDEESEQQECFNSELEDPNGFDSTLSCIASKMSPFRPYNDVPIAVRSNSGKKFQFDAEGRDWRDIPRGDNNDLTVDFIRLLKLSQEDSTIFITPIVCLVDELKSMTRETISSQKSQKIISSVAWVVQYEYEATLMDVNELANKQNDPTVNTDVIYDLLKTDNNFEKMVKFNPSASFCIIDELLMVSGYRRVFIWFLTHLELNQWLINYFHEILIGHRGDLIDSNEPRSAKFSFSRKGKLELSEIEKSMLLHEFFSNAVIYLSRGASFELEDLTKYEDNECVLIDGSKFITNRSNAQKLMKVICLMLKSLEEKNILKLNDPEYRIEIQTLLVQWVGVGLVPEAKELFFKSNEFESKEEIQKRVLAQKKIRQEKLEYEMNEVDFFKLFENNFEKDSFEFLITILHLGAFYPDKRLEILSFFKDLNSVEKVFKTTGKLYKVCDYLFEGFFNAIINKNQESVLGLMKKFNLANIDNQFVIQTIFDYLLKQKTGFEEEADLNEEDNKADERSINASASSIENKPPESFITDDESANSPKKSKEKVFRKKRKI